MSPTSPCPRLFLGARVFDGTSFLEASDVRTDANGKISAIGVDFRRRDGEVVHNLAGAWLLPGLVDCHVHFREPGLERKEGYSFGSKGALHGGVTTVCEIQNNPPLMDSASILRQKLHHLRGISHVDYAPYGSLVESSLAELPAIKGLCPAVKCFLGCSTGAGGVRDEEELRRWFTAAAEAGVKVVAHCEDNAIMEATKKQYAEQPELLNRHDLRRPREAEVESIRQAIAVATEVGVHLHVFHISTVEGATLVTAAAGRGMAVTGSTAPHYLLITADEAHLAPQHRFKVNPSIKYQEDCQGLGRLVQQGFLPVVGTDHAPHPLTEKDRPYAHAASGFPSVDLLLPLMFAAADAHQSPPEPFLHAVTQGPAEEFGFQQKGRIAVGADADLVVIQPQLGRVVDEAQLLSRSGWSPYHRRLLRGFPEQVFLRGHEVFADGQILGPPRGEPLFV